MIVGVMQVHVVIHESFSLKDKRRVVKAMKDRISNEFNVSIAEVDALDDRRQAVLGVSLVGNDSRFVRTCLDEVLKHLRGFRGASVIDHQVDLV